MNKRQKKKTKKKQELFVASFVSSYRDLRELERSYHEYVLNYERRLKFSDDVDDELYWVAKEWTMKVR